MSENGLTRVLFLSATKKWRSAETSTIARLKALGEITAGTPVRESMIEPGVPAALHPATRDHFSDEDRAQYAPEPEPEPEAAAEPAVEPAAGDGAGAGTDAGTQPEVPPESPPASEPPAAAYSVSGQFRVDAAADKAAAKAADGGVEPAAPEPPKVKNPAPTVKAASAAPAAAEMKGPAPAAPTATVARAASPKAKPPSSQIRLGNEKAPWKIFAGVGLVSVAVLLALNVFNNLVQPSTVPAREPSRQAAPPPEPVVAEHRAFMRRASDLRAEPNAQSPQRASVARGVEVVRLGAVRPDGWARIRLSNRTTGYVRASALGDSAAPRLAAGSQLSRRTITGGPTEALATPGGTVRLTPLRNGQTIQVVGVLQDRRDWAEVILDDGRVGYIPMRALQRPSGQPAATARGQAAPAAAPSAPAPAERLVFARVAAAIHSDASSTSRRIANAARGTSLTQLGETGAGGWARVRTAEGRTGWVRVQQIGDSRPPVLDGAGARQLTVTAPVARVFRRVEGDSFAELPSGRLVTVAGRLRNQTAWAEVIMPDGEVGYMQMADFEPRSPQRAPESAAQSAPAQPPARDASLDGQPAAPAQAASPPKGPGAAPGPAPEPVTSVVWVRRPSAQDMVSAQPRRLQRWRGAQQVTFQCRFSARNRLEQCLVIPPTTSDNRFHEWGRAIMAQYEARPLDENGQPVAGRVIFMPTLEFEPPR